MKKCFVPFFTILMILTISCNKEILTDEVESGNVSKHEMLFNAGIETVKCTISGRTVNWETSDQIAIYDGQSLNAFRCLGADGASATFGGAAGEADTYVAVYPNAAASLDESQIYVEIPSAQVVDASHSVDPSALLAVATSGADGAISFRNKFSLVKFEIPDEGITSFSLVGNNSEKIAGRAILDQQTLETGVADGNKVTVTYAGGGDFPVGVYYAAIYPTTFEKGFRVVLGNEDGWKGANGTSAEIVFPINSGVDFGQISSVVWVPEEITTAAQLKAWGYISDLYADGEAVKLGADINYEGNEWIPAKSFKGTFDGQNHRVSNIKITSTQTRTGFLTVLNGGTLKNVCFGSSDYDFAKGSAADAGTYDVTSEIILNYSSDNPTDWTYAGLIAYTNSGSTISNVVNFIPVSSTTESDAQMRLGGITGILKGDCRIEGCVNYGQITNNASSSSSENTSSANAGICGWTDGNGNVISGCTNYGDVVNKHPFALQLAGILGASNGSILISECSNKANISSAATSTGSAYVGGILGVNNGKNVSTVIDRCSNDGTVTFDGEILTQKQSVYLGGICGYARLGAQIKGCSNGNNGKIHSNVATGVKVYAYIGGICGTINNVTITRSDDGVHTVNSGSIAQNVDFQGNIILGGIVGYCAGDSATSSFSYCDNCGDVSTNAAFEYKTAVTTGHGGICGYDKSGNTYSYCTNSATVNANAKDNSQTYYVGGILGGNGSPLSMSHCENSGQVTLTRGTKSSVAGGICSTFNAAKATMTDCINRGKMFNNRDNASIAIGALIGQLTANTTEGEVTICQGCGVLAPQDNVIIYSPDATVGDTGHIGLIYGKISGTNASELNVGPVRLESGMIIKKKNDDSIVATISSDNVSDYLAGKGDTVDPNINFICSVE